MPLVLVLLVLGVFARLIPHPPGAVALGAIALYAGAKLPRRWAFVLPLAILVVSDLGIDFGKGYEFHWPTRLTTYAFFTLAVAMGRIQGVATRVWVRSGLAAAAATVFFLVSNYIVWRTGQGFGFPITLEGLADTYRVALPFYRNSLIAEVLGVNLLFGIDALLSLDARRAAAAEQAGR